MAYMLAILAVFFWSFNVIVGSALQGILTPWQIAFFRWAIAGICLVPFTYKRVMKEKMYLKREWKFILYSSLIGITFCNTCVYYASYTLSAVQMSLISVTGPVFLLLFAHFLGGAFINKRAKIGMLFAVIGVFVIILKGRLQEIFHFPFQMGDFWMVAMACSFGFYSYLMSSKPSTLSQESLLTVGIVVGALGCLPFFIYETVRFPLIQEHLTWGILGITLYMGIFNSVLAYFFWNKALEKLGSIKVSVVYYLMPIFSTIEAFFLLKESLVWTEIIGGGCILLGIFLTNTKMRTPWHIERA